MRKHLIVADLHFTRNYFDEYRWGIFQTLSELIVEHRIEVLDVLGDLTEKKDNHSSSLVNRIAIEFYRLRVLCPNLKINILKGNHDYIDPNEPFFQFLAFEDVKIDYIVTPEDDGDIAYIPHGFDIRDSKDCKYVFFHDAIYNFHVRADKTSSNGIKQSDLDKNVQYYGGHFHTPQNKRNVTYIGTPYHVYFGDSYDSRCIILDSNGSISISLADKFIRKYKVELCASTGIESFDQLRENDQLKIIYNAQREEVSDWNDISVNISNYCAEHKYRIKSIELQIISEDGEHQKIKRIKADEDLLYKSYVETNSLPDEYVEIGRKILREVKNV